jgi:hypothetical protein
VRHVLVPLHGSGFGESAPWLAGTIAARTRRGMAVNPAAEAFSFLLGADAEAIDAAAIAAPGGSI